MKKYLIIMSTLSALLLITACGKETNKQSNTIDNSKNINNIVSVLDEFYGFSCENNRCENEIIEGYNEVITTIIFDFNENTLYKYEENTITNETYNLQYDYNNINSLLEYSILQADSTTLYITSKLNKNNDYDCTSTKTGWNPDDNFNTCDPLKTYIMDFMEYFVTLLDENDLTIIDIL